MDCRDLRLCDAVELWQHSDWHRLELIQSCPLSSLIEMRLTHFLHRSYCVWALTRETKCKCTHCANTLLQLSTGRSKGEELFEADGHQVVGSVSAAVPIKLFETPGIFRQIKITLQSLCPYFWKNKYSHVVTTAEQNIFNCFFVTRINSNDVLVWYKQPFQSWQQWSQVCAVMKLSGCRSCPRGRYFQWSFPKWKPRKACQFWLLTADGSAQPRRRWWLLPLQLSDTERGLVGCLWKGKKEGRQRLISNFEGSVLMPQNPV